jgi:hypothetical protein
MKFIIDGDGTVSKRAAKDLLMDIMHPYDKNMVVTTHEGGFSSYSDYMTTNIATVLKIMEDTGFIDWNITLNIDDELALTGDKIFIVLDASTRPDLVSYCWEHDIPVLDLTKALYPVKRN